MNKRHFVWALACAVAVMLCGVAWQPAVAAQTVKASIDGRKGTCVPRPGFLTVPAGKRAVGFRVVQLGSGYNCHSGLKLGYQGFSIKRGKGQQSVYNFYRNERGKSNETGGPLARLALPAGSYVVYVDGGYNAVVVLQYDLK